MGEELEPSDSLDESEQEAGFDLVAAQVRAYGADADTFFEVLASKLKDALGDRVKLERVGGLLKRSHLVSGIELDLTSSGEGMVLRARRERTGVSCSVARSVRGIVLSTKQMPVGEWIEELVGALSQEAERSERTWTALHGLLS